MALRDERGRPNRKIINETFMSSNLLLCALCSNILVDVAEECVNEYAGPLGLQSLAHANLIGAQHMRCRECDLIWQYLTSVVFTDGDKPEQLACKLRAFNLETLTQMESWTKTMPFREDDETTPLLKPTGANAFTAVDEVVVVHYSGYGLPQEFQNLGPTPTCFSAYEAECYLAYAHVRETDPAESHLFDCGFCLRLLAIAQTKPPSLCPPVDILMKAKSRTLPNRLFNYIFYHAHATKQFSGDCTCAHTWHSLRPRTL